MADKVLQKVSEAVEAGASLEDVDAVTKGQFDIREPETVPFNVPVGAEFDTVKETTSRAESEDVGDIVDFEAALDEIDQENSFLAELDAIDAGVEDVEPEPLSFEGELMRLDAEVAGPGSPEASEWRKQMYAFESAPTDVENLETFLQSRFPRAFAWGFTNEEGDDWGLDFRSGDDLYGEGFMAATPEERRKMILKAKQDVIDQEYQDVLASGDVDRTLGTVLGTLATPTVLLPFGGQTKLGQAAAGSIIGGVDAGLHDLAQNGELTAKNVGLGITIGAIAPPALSTGAEYGAKAAKKVAAPIVRKNAVNKVAAIQDELDIGIAKGLDIPTAFERALEQVDVTPDQYGNLLKVVGKENKPRIHSRAQALERAELAQGNKSAIGSWLYTHGGEAVDSIMGGVYTRIKNIAPEVAHRLRELDYNVSRQTHEALERTAPFLRRVEKLPQQYRPIVAKALMNGEFDLVRDVMETTYGKAALDEFDSTVKTLNDYRDKLVKSGYDVGDIENYFPRLIKDKDGLFKELGREAGKDLQAELKKAAAKKPNKRLTQHEESMIINKFMRGYLPKEGAKPGFVKGRKISKIPEKFVKYYEDPTKAMHSYIRQMTNDLEKRAFFGKMGVTHKAGGAAAGDVEDIINNSIGSLVDAKKLDTDQDRILRQLLHDRLVMAERSPSGFIQNTKNILYSTTLANPISAATQLGDVFIAAQANGLRNTFEALFGQKRIDMRDLGLDDVAQELTSDLRATARALDGLMKASAFKAVDRFGKNTLLNGALRKNAKLAKGDPKQLQELGRKWRDVFGKDYPKLVNDLREGRMSEQVKLLLWNELADVQPIALSEMPEKYLRHPNGRLLYMLRTFTLKQMDLMRRSVVQEFKRGSKKRAFRNAMTYATAMQLAGMTTDQVKSIMLGREADPSDASIQSFWALLGTSSYVADKIKKGQIEEAVTDTIMPPLGALTDLAQSALSVLPDEDAAFGDAGFDPKVVKHVPILGKLVYNRALGGNEEYQERIEREEWEALQNGDW
ncbi:hypothetical protein [Zhongshania sp.]|uniref:hypothetical protein n=1 Tax=Zhongshania sp. TaxID=1971902 RepID=UPI0035616F37